MLELYHHINSVCAQKVRIALLDKGVEAVEHLMNLGGDQFNPEYLKLNPNAVVPTLVHDGRPIIESSVILGYLDEAFPGPSLTPSGPFDRARMRLFLKLIDEYIHDSCTIITFATAFRDGALKRTVEQFEAYLAKSPNKKRSEHRRDVIAKGVDSEFVIEALTHHEKLLSWMDDSLQQATYLAGSSYSIADIAVIPYIIRLDILKLSQMWENRPRVAEWYSNMLARRSIQDAIFGRMRDEDHAPFKNISNDLWAKVQKALAARP